MEYKWNYFVTLFIYCQVAVSQSNYWIYHQIINKAEERISTEEFGEALVLYDSAFASFEYVFVKDYIIAAQLAALINDRTRCIDYIEKSIKNGYKCYCLENMPPLSKVLRNDDWEELKEKELDLRKQYLESIDRDLNIEFSRRYREEQEYKGTPFGDRIIRLNYDRIVSLMDTFLFLSERIIGLDDKILDNNKNSTPAELKDCEAGNSKVIVTLTHSKDPISHFGMNYLLYTVENGYLHPRELKTLYEYSPTRGDWDWNGIKLFERPDLKLRAHPGEELPDFARIDSDRMLLGLGPVKIDVLNEQIASKYNLRLGFGYK